MKGLLPPPCTRTACEASRRQAWPGLAAAGDDAFCALVIPTLMPIWQSQRLFNSYASAAAAAARLVHECSPQVGLTQQIYSFLRYGQIGQICYILWHIHTFRNRTARHRCTDYRARATLVQI